MTLAQILMSRLREAHGQRERLFRPFQVATVLRILGDAARAGLVSDSELREILDEHERIRQE